MREPNKQNYFYLFAVLTIAWCISWIMEDNVGNFHPLTLIVIFVFGIGINVWAARVAYFAAIRRYLKHKKD